MKLCLVCSQGKRYLAEQKRITLRKETNVQPAKKEIHPLSWLLGWMIPVLKMTFWDLLNMQTQDNFLWLTYKWQLQFKTPTNANMPSMNVSEKTKKSRNKVEDFKIDEFVSIKITKVTKLRHYIQMYCLEKLQKLITTMLKCN